MSRRRRQQNRTLLYFALTGAFALALGVATFIKPDASALTGAYPASSVLGQTSFAGSSSNQGGSAGASTLSTPITTALDTVHHRLFVADGISNSRVLVYNLDSNNNLTGSSASIVLGQSGLSATGQGGGQAGLNNPYGLAYDPTDNLLFVNDNNASRVLVFDASNLSDGMNAKYVLGQSGYGGSTGADTQTGLDYPEALSYDATDHLLFVADTGNNRVVAYDTTALATGMNAKYVLGQSGYTTNANATTQTGLYGPEGVDYDASDHLLFVADTQNRRVVAYNTAALANDMNASFELGQTGYTTRVILDTQSGMALPKNVAYDSINHQVFVSDSYNARILAFNVVGATSGENATSVLGESDFVSGNNTTPTASQTAFGGGTTYPMGMTFDASNNRLYLADGVNSRVLIFNFVHLTTSALPAGSVGSTYSGTLASAGSQGTVTYAVTSGSLPAGITLNGSTGVLSGKPTIAGSYTFEITATDSAGGIGSFLDDPTFTISVGSAVGAPDTGFGSFTSSSTRVATELGIIALSAFVIVFAARRLAKR